jgi:hypothetical protein
MAWQGRSPTVVQARLGHALIQIIADRYGHLFQRVDDRAEMPAAEIWGVAAGRFSGHS